jgi:hypothetical protein
MSDYSFINESTIIRIVLIYSIDTFYFESKLKYTIQIHKNN